jgi:DNA repair protein RadC
MFIHFCEVVHHYLFNIPGLWLVAPHVEKIYSERFPSCAKNSNVAPMCGKSVHDSNGANGERLRASELPHALQPREKFDRIGPENLAESDLLALLLRTGSRGLNVVSLAEQLLLEYGTLSALSQASATELCRLRGIGREKAKILKAALELGRRLVQEKVGERPRIIAPEDAAAVLRERARTLDREVFWVLLLDTRSRLLAPPCEISKGTLNSSLVHPREVFKPAIRNSAAALILAHNHPSGDPSPSAQDVQITRKLTEAGRLLDIRVLDHLILGRQLRADAADFVSLREAGLAEFDSPARSFAPHAAKNLSDGGADGV